jgi:hypothetical protein
MRTNTRFAPALARVLWASGLLFALTLFFWVDARSQEMIRSQFQTGAIKNVPESSVVRAVAERPLALGNLPQVTRYDMELDGDRSVEAATVVEQVRTGLISYTVGLQLASGAQQSIALRAPPGGLRVEMRDMTGDHVPNDLVLVPALLHWPLAVLVNEGHDHFVVAVSGAFPGTLGSHEDHASKSRDARSFALLTSSGFNTGGLTNGSGLFPPRSQGKLLSAITPSAATGLGSSSRFGRAPPALTLTT